jgi:hypothetical protein
MSLRSQFIVSVAIGVTAAFTVLAAGIAMIKFHGGIWPWWFHGTAVALITGVITTLLTHLHVREVSRRESRRLAGERMSHELCTALQILFQCTYLQPSGRSQSEGEAIKRLHVAAREILPNLFEISNGTVPVPPSDGQAQTKARAAAGSG